MSKKRTVNRNLIGAGKQFKSVKNAKGHIQWAKSVRQQGTSKSTSTKKAPNKNVVAKMSFKASAKFQPQISGNANIKTTVRFKGLQKMKGKIAKSTPVKTQPAKAKTVKKKPPTKGR